MEANWQEVLAFTIPGRPQQRGSKSAQVKYNSDGQPITKNGRVLTFATDDNEKSKVWMAEVRAAAFEAMRGCPLLASPLALSITFHFKRPSSHFGSGRNSGSLKASAPLLHAQSPDLAKLIRCLEDGLTGVVWTDDKLVCDYLPPMGRRWTETSERAEVKIYAPADVAVATW